MTPPFSAYSYGLSTHNASLALFFDFLQRDTKANVYVLAVQPGRSEIDRPLGSNVEKRCRELELLLPELLPK